MRILFFGISVFAILGLAACSSTSTPIQPTSPSPSFAPTQTAALIASPKPPRVFSSDPQTLANTKVKIAAGDQQIAPVLAWLISEANKALRVEPVSVIEKKILPPSGNPHDYMSMAPYWWPDPSKPSGLPYIRKDGQTNPELHSVPDKDNLNAMASNVYTLALAYYFTGDERYAERAVAWLRVWFLNADTKMNPNLNFGQAVRGVTDGRGEGVLETRMLTQVVDALGLLADYSGLTPADHQGLTQWFGDYAAWMVASPIGKAERAAKNNHGTWYDAQLVDYLLFLNKTDDAKKILEDAKRNRIDAQIEPDGRMPLETERADAWHYTVFDLKAFFTLATFGDRAGVDLWNYSSQDGRGIRKALDYLTRYIVDEKWPHSSSSDMSWGDVYNLLRTAAVKYGTTNYLQIAKRIPTVIPATPREDLLLPNLGR